MPMMKPMKWMLIFLFSIMSLIMFIKLTYFINNNFNMKLLKSNFMKKKINIKW